MIDVRRLHHVEPEARSEEGERDQQQQRRFPDLVAHEHEALGRRREQHHRNDRDNEHEDRLRPTHVDQQQVGVEDEQERQQRGADVIGESLDTGPDRVAARNRRRGERGQADRRRVVGEDAEVEHEQVHRDQRHDQPALGAERDDDRRHQRRHDDVVGRRRQAHAENQAHDRNQDQHHDQAAAGQEFDEFADHLVRAGQRNRTDDDTGGAGGDGDADHVARTGDHAVDPVADAGTECRAVVVGLAEELFEHVLRQGHDDHRNRRPEGRQPGRQPLDDDAPDQDHDRQDVIKAGDRGRAGFRQFEDRVVGRVDLEVGLLRRDVDEIDVGRGGAEGDDPEGRAGRDVLDPAEAEVDDKSEYGDADEATEKTDHLHHEGQR